MRTAPALILATTLAACDDTGSAARFPESPEAAKADVAGTLERVDPESGDWVGVEVVDLVTADGTCGLSREIVAVEAEICEGCRLTLVEVSSTVVDEVGECDVDLDRLVPSAGPSLAFRASVDWLLPARGEVLVGAGDDAWVPYSFGLLELGELSYQHRTRLGGPGVVHDGGGTRDLPNKPVIR